MEGKTCFIYHAHDHYFCPVGYEIIPKGDYNEFEDCSSDLIGDSDMWMLIGEPSKCFPIFHTANWKEVDEFVYQLVLVGRWKAAHSQEKLDTELWNV